MAQSVGASQPNVTGSSPLLPNKYVPNRSIYLVAYEFALSYFCLSVLHAGLAYVDGQNKEKRLATTEKELYCRCSKKSFMICSKQMKLTNI